MARKKKTVYVEILNMKWVSYYDYYYRWFGHY